MLSRNKMEQEIVQETIQLLNKKYINLLLLTMEM
jgi:hypothetical protein